MAIIEKQARRKVIDLTGPEGNAFVLLGYAKTFGKQLGLTEKHINQILEDMQSSDYENLITVFDEEFGMIVDLER